MLQLIKMNWIPKTMIPCRMLGLCVEVGSNKYWYFAGHPSNLMNIKGKKRKER